MLLSAIVIAEIAFWIFLLAGLCARYILRWNKLSILLLLMTPVCDLVLLGYTYFDLTKGQDASFAHGLSVFYIAFTVTFGPRVVRIIDERFANRFRHEHKRRGQKLSRPKGREQEYRAVKSDWKKSLYAGGIAIVLLAVLIFAAGLENSFWLLYWMVVVLSTVALWWFIGPRRSRKKLLNESRSSTASESRS